MNDITANKIASPLSLIAQRIRFINSSAIYDITDSISDFFH